MKDDTFEKRLETMKFMEKVGLMNPSHSAEKMQLAHEIYHACKEEFSEPCDCEGETISEKNIGQSLDEFIEEEGLTEAVDAEMEKVLNPDRREFDTIDELLTACRLETIDESELIIQVDNDSVWFGLDIGDGEEPEEIIVHEAEGYKDVKSLYQLLFPWAVVDWV